MIIFSKAGKKKKTLKKIWIKMDASLHFFFFLSIPNFRGGYFLIEDIWGTYQSQAGFLNFGSVDISAREFFVVGELSCAF